jgi:hypothetical protein
VRKISGAYKVVTVAGVAAGLLCLGGGSGVAFADTPSSNDGLVTTNPCPDKWVGTEVGVDGHVVFACTNLIP